MKKQSSFGKGKYEWMGYRQPRNKKEWADVNREVMLLHKNGQFTCGCGKPTTHSVKRANASAESMSHDYFCDTCFAKLKRPQK